ncbi:unnamed protein product [Amoebophrya sp. A120]|nr:unnamed protein product [Amoebophrya sp. A120]|eukprot:GSA120T00018113001.1
MWSVVLRKAVYHFGVLQAFSGLAFPPFCDFEDDIHVAQKIEDQDHLLLGAARTAGEVALGEDSCVEGFAYQNRVLRRQNARSTSTRSSRCGGHEKGNEAGGVALRQPKKTTSAMTRTLSRRTFLMAYAVVLDRSTPWVSTAEETRPTPRRKKSLLQRGKSSAFILTPPSLTSTVSNPHKNRIAAERGHRRALRRTEGRGFTQKVEVDKILQHQEAFPAPLLAQHLHHQDHHAGSLNKAGEEQAAKKDVKTEQVEVPFHPDFFDARISERSTAASAEGNDIFSGSTSTSTGPRAPLDYGTHWVGPEWSESRYGTDPMQGTFLTGTEKVENSTNTCTEVANFDPFAGGYWWEIRWKTSSDVSAEAGGDGEQVQQAAGGSASDVLTSSVLKTNSARYVYTIRFFNRRGKEHELNHAYLYVDDEHLPHQGIPIGAISSAPANVSVGLFTTGGTVVQVGKVVREKLRIWKSNAFSLCGIFVYGLMQRYPSSALRATQESNGDHVFPRDNGAAICPIDPHWYEFGRWPVALSHTAAGGGNRGRYWQLEFADREPHYVDQIRLLNRRDCCPDRLDRLYVYFDEEADKIPAVHEAFALNDGTHTVGGGREIAAAPWGSMVRIERSFRKMKLQNTGGTLEFVVSLSGIDVYADTTVDPTGRILEVVSENPWTRSTTSSSSTSSSTTTSSSLSNISPAAVSGTSEEITSVSAQPVDVVVEKEMVNDPLPQPEGEPVVLGGQEEEEHVEKQVSSSTSTTTITIPTPPPATPSPESTAETPTPPGPSSGESEDQDGVKKVAEPTTEKAAPGPSSRESEDQDVVKRQTDHNVYQGAPVHLEAHDAKESDTEEHDSEVEGTPLSNSADITPLLGDGAESRTDQVASQVQNKMQSNYLLPPDLMQTLALLGRDAKKESNSTEETGGGAGGDSTENNTEAACLRIALIAVIGGVLVVCTVFVIAFHIGEEHDREDHAGGAPILAAGAASRTSAFLNTFVADGAAASSSGFDPDSGQLEEDEERFTFGKL